MKDWGHLLRFVEENGAAAVTGLRALEDRGEQVTLGGLRRSLRPLLTPEARRKLLPYLLSSSATMRSLDAASLRVQKEMWLTWHWAPYNKYLHKEIRMLPAPPSVCSRG